MQRAGELEWVTVVIEQQLVDEQMRQGDSQRNTESSEEKSLELHILWSVYPLKQTQYEERHCPHHGQSQVQYGDVKVAVHAVVECRKAAASDEYIDASIVEAVENRVRAYMMRRLRLDIG